VEDKDFLLVNVHIPYDGEIKGTDLNIPYNQINRIVEAIPDLNSRIVLYCRSGSMSASASKELASRGYVNITELVGGYNAWQRAGGPMER
jgi:rhodanese-related sulfurtransferase